MFENRHLLYNRFERVVESPFDIDRLSVQTQGFSLENMKLLFGLVLFIYIVYVSLILKKDGVSKASTMIRYKEASFSTKDFFKQCRKKTWHRKKENNKNNGKKLFTFMYYTQS